ncbi:MAG: 2-dehydropantoate 2-reductase [Chloroflexota bacterium]
MTHIAIVGAGALGCLFAARLSDAGNSVTLVARRPETVDLINRAGIRLETPEGPHLVRVTARLAPDVAEEADVAIVLVKAYDTPGAAETASQVLRPDGCAVTLQNGLGNAEALVHRLGEQRVLGGVTSQGANVIEGGHIRHAGFGPTALAECHGGVTGRSEQIASMLSQAGIPATAEPEIAPLVWGKLIANAAINPLGALLRCRNGDLPNREASAAIFTSLAREAGQVALVAGVALPFPDAVEHAHHVAEATSQNLCSMLQDVRARRRTEIDAINGAIAEHGQRLGVPTPANTSMAGLIRAVEERYTLEPVY